MWLFIAAVSAFWAVAAGAFGAHALRPLLGDDLAGVYRTGVEYHFYHALALLSVAWLDGKVRSPAVGAAGLFFLAGTVLFSGSLYTMAITGIRGLGVITPLGGIAFLAGWACIIWVGIRHLSRLRS
jgi:uncharacterized membrane protein YgdD (TMEM256/DUF423 family)